MKTVIKWIFLSIPLVLVGCSSAPSIYLNERYLTDENTASVREKLSEEGYNVTTVNIPFPTSVSNSTVMYSPLLSAEATLDTVVKALEQQGYTSLNVIPLKQGNHWYKKNSVGLYLLPPGIKSLAASDQQFAQQYRSEGCSDKSSLQLKRDKTFIYINGNNQLSGRWEIPDMPYLRLYSKKPYINFYYSISTDTRSDNLGEIDITTLNPMSESSDIPDCHMLYGVRR
ncbi:MAG: hypothetical protein ACQEQ8_07565 [Pseudomonadota bacterium]